MSVVNFGSDIEFVEGDNQLSTSPASASDLAEDEQVIVPDIGFSGEESGDDVFFYDAAGENTMFRRGKKRFNKDGVKKGTIKTARGSKITSASGPLSHLSIAPESPTTNFLLPKRSIPQSRQPVTERNLHCLNLKTEKLLTTPYLPKERPRTQGPYKYRVMDGLKRAKATKAEVENNISVLMPQDKKTSTRPSVEEDPENILIKTLRQDQKLLWSEIASHLNQERLSKGEPATFTDAAVYSRFVRNAPRIATSVGEIGFDPKDYMHLRNPNQYSNAEGTGVLSKAGKKRIKDFNNATELKDNLRHAVPSEVHENDLETPQMTEQLMDAVAKCERNFWKYVADELERATAKMYDAEKLSERYHAI
ncbi:hypothetical protein J4E85_011488 [Alternaria conjuncta]|uniref:uncharacterized protein n=1 Tax=Alternaria conjuncta TaxID=181017 RepID=UPI00221E6C6B|nr:uncharacterized protein J4E85_011488 [Alternaria conjuncta]KAI4909812.1 hypothetical protein J4E85_011488 [Alternaria conjuncta]